jgi:prevent-host-death family protein
MPERISAKAARAGLGRIMNQVANQGREFVIERGGRPVAALIPMARLELLEQTREESSERFFCTVEMLRRRVRDLDQEELQQAIFEADEAARQAGVVRSGR